MRLIYADYNPYTNSIDVNTFENYILRIAAFCGLSFLLAIKITSKLSNFILHQFGGLHKLWDAPAIQNMIDLGLTREQILRKYSPEEYDEALRSMSVKANYITKVFTELLFLPTGRIKNRRIQSLISCCMCLNPFFVIRSDIFFNLMENNQGKHFHLN